MSENAPMTRRFTELFSAMLKRRLECPKMQKCFSIAQTMRHSERNRRVKFHRASRCFVLMDKDGKTVERRLSGINRVLGVLLCGSVEVSAAYDKMFWRRKAKRGARTCSTGGRDHGLAVHSQVEKLIKMMTHPKT